MGIIKKNQIEGKVIETLPELRYKVVLKNGQEITAYLSGKMRINKIRVMIGDKVLIETTPYDKTKGRITYRL